MSYIKAKLHLRNHLDSEILIITFETESKFSLGK